MPDYHGWVRTQLRQGRGHQRGLRLWRPLAVAGAVTVTKAGAVEHNHPMVPRQHLQ
ncbi:hypothetical protein D3C71_2137680 [compost metagenome]